MAMVLAHVLGGRRDASIRFDELRSLLLALGFSERVRGSHHIFGKPGVREVLNLQRDGRDAKRYQVGQIRRLVLSYNLRLRG
jgi:predicted RNA binding protein YcfA (HicA-like mRNA interferase family)